MDPIPSIHGQEKQQLESQEQRAADAGTAAGSYAEYLRQEQTPPQVLPDGAKCSDCDRLLTCAYTSPRNRWCIITPSQFKRGIKAVVSLIVALLLPTISNGQAGPLASKSFSSTGGASPNAVSLSRQSPAVPRLIHTPPVLRPSRAQWMRVTFYCPCEICCGPHACGITASGRPAVGSIAAVDPKHIALGSMVRVGQFGWMLACDKGKKIKGPNRLDVLKPTHAEAIQASGPKGYLWLCVEITSRADYQRRLEDALFWKRFDDLVRAGRRLATQPTFTGARCGAAVSNPPPEASGAPPVIQP